VVEYKNDNEPLISVVIPVFNRLKELNRAIQSVLSQTYKNWELWIVDDSSTEDTETIIEQFKHANIYFIRSNKKGNANICRNIGIKNAAGEYIAMLDSDDEWLPDHLEMSINALKELEVEGLFGSFYVNNGVETKPYLNRPQKPDEDMVNYILSGNPTATPTHLYRSDCIRDILWDEQLHRHQDYDLIIRFSDKYKMAVVHLLTVVVHWRQGEKRMYHLPSHILFIERYAHRMSIKSFIKINLDNYTVLRNTGVNLNELKYFKKNILSNIKHLGFVDYMTLYSNKNGVFRKIYLRINYLLKVLIS